MKESFDRAWKRLARESACDGFESTEYYRVLQEWEQCGKPMPLARFIRWRANLPSRSDAFEKLSPYLMLQLGFRVNAEDVFQSLPLGVVDVEWTTTPEES